MSSDNIINKMVSALEGIPAMLMSALSKREEDFKNRIEKEIEKIIAELDIEKVVNQTAKPLLEEALATVVKNHMVASGASLIAEHLDKVVKGSEGFASKLLKETVTQEPVKGNAASRVPFSDGLTLNEIQGLHNSTDLKVINDFTDHNAVNALFDEVQKEIIMQGKNPEEDEAILIVCAKDYKSFAHEFAYGYKSDNSKSLLSGQVGILFGGIEVYSDFFLDEKYRLLTQSGFAIRPVELNHTTIAQENMGEITPA